MSKKPYTVKPASGQALLNYQNRLMPGQGIELPLYEANETERLGNKKSNNYLLQGDCLSACAWLRTENIAVDLVYIDPPFASGANYAKALHLRGGATLDNGDVSIGEEVMYGDIWQKEDYLNWLYERLIAIREVMSENGSIYVHLDWHIGHYAKILMDEVFGENNFVNEIIVCYSGPTNQRNNFPRKHDTIYFYSKTSEYKFNSDSVRVGYKKSNLATGKTALSGRADDEYLKKLDKQGKQIEDWWPDIRTGSHIPKEIRDEAKNYPTLKDTKLLQRIIKASSSKGDIIADFFCGSGTTAKVAHDTGRRFIASDISQNALQTTRDRLAKNNIPCTIMSIKDGARLFRNPAQTEEQIFKLLPGWQPQEDTQLREFWDGAIADGNRQNPVKFVGMDKRLTRQFISVVLEEAGQADTDRALIIYAYKSMDVTQKVANQLARAHLHSDTDIQLKSLDELLGNRATQLFGDDSVEFTCHAENDQYHITVARFYSPYLTQKIREHNEARAGTLLAQGKGKGDKKITISDNGLELVESVQFGTLNNKSVWRSMVEDHPSAKQTINRDYRVAKTATHIRIRSIAGDEITEPLLPQADE